MSKKMEEVRDAGVRVVSEDFLTDIKSSGKALQELVSLHAISPWGAVIKAENQAAPLASKSKAAAAKSTGRVKEEEGKVAFIKMLIDFWLNLRSHQFNCFHASLVFVLNDCINLFIGGGKSKTMKLTVKGGAAVDPDSGSTSVLRVNVFRFLYLPPLMILLFLLLLLF